MLMPFSSNGRRRIRAQWGDIHVPSVPGQENNLDLPMNFGGGSRMIGVSSTQSVNYRINSGSWVGYTVPFSVSDSQTLAWQFVASGLLSPTSVTIYDNTLGNVIRAFNVSAGS